MAMLELVQSNADWWAALETALTRPEGVPERRSGEDPWSPDPVARPRRISDDLAWFRYAYEQPAAHGLHAVDGTAGVAMWHVEARDATEKLSRLRDRGVLQAAGFVLHERDGD